MVDDLELRVKYKPLHLDPMDKYKLLEIIRHWKMFFSLLGRPSIVKNNKSVPSDWKFYEDHVIKVLKQEGWL